MRRSREQGTDYERLSAARRTRRPHRCVGFHSLRPYDAAPCRQGGGTVVRAACRAGRADRRGRPAAARSYPAARRALCASSLPASSRWPAARISSPARCPAAAASAARCLSCCRMTARMRSTLPARGGLIPPDAFGALSYSFLVLETRRGGAVPSRRLWTMGSR